MTHASLAESPSTSSMLDMLISRWQVSPSGETLFCDPPAGAMERARSIVAQTVGHYVNYLEPSDQALYNSLISAPDAPSLRALFFQCFDLMVRTRGTALAVLRLHELYRLVR